MNRILLIAIALGLGCGGGAASAPDPGPIPDAVHEDVVGSDPIEEGPLATDPATAEDAVPPPRDPLSEDRAFPDLPPDLPPVDAPPPCEEGKPCDDGDPCTHSDRCVGGACQGKAYACDDGRPCTDDLCDGYGGCRYPVRDGSCLIHNTCYEAGQGSLLNPCALCDPTVSKVAFAVAADGTPCGQDDPCLAEGICQGGQCGGGPTDCDDGNLCTDDHCEQVQGCLNVSNHDPCEDGDPCTLGDQCVDGACVTGYLEMDCHDDNPCTTDLCSQDGCVHLPVAGPCEDGDLCTEGDRCEDGECVPGPPLVCDDGNDCTNDWCEGWLGCRHSVADSPCCIGTIHICNDLNPCTRDLCDPDTGTCAHEPVVGPCNDGDRCTGPDECGEDGQCKGPPLDCDDLNPCTQDSCDPTKGCVTLPVTGPCDDHNACTLDDTCVSGQCKGKPLSCDDHNACTQDSCDPASGCRNEPFTGPCNDNNACTANDMCSGGVCQGVPIACDDHNACTADSCHPVAGCQHVPVAGPCDDGNDCTVDDHCEAGLCTGTPQGLCCTPRFTAPVNKVTVLALGESGRPGHALNVDGKPTCSPPDNCEAGLDNSLAPFAGLANQPLQEAVDKGEVNLLFEHRGFNTGGQPYTLALWQGEPLDPTCDVQHQTCAYLVPAELIGPDCEPIVAFHNVKVSGTKLTAGGVGNNYPFSIPIAPGVVLDVVLVNAMMEATLTIQGGKPTAMNGVLAGAVPKATMIAAVQAIPDNQLPVSKDLILQMLNLLIVNDVDSDGDGNLDAASVGIRFQAIGGTIAGVQD